MANVVIVAIPEKDDYVWKISSERIPHLTILSLGEQEIGPMTARIVGYLEHAANTMLHKFHMSVSKRGELGPKEADVVFFEKRWASEVTAFRDALLKQGDILELFNGSEQFPEWIPHLTLGFPEAPAHEDDRDYPGIHGVHFDKVALWTDNYDGPEFELPAWESEMWMSALQGGLDLGQKLGSLDLVQAEPKKGLALSEKPWSSYKKSDYTPEQWHNACLIHQHEDGTPTNKSKCKLPVKTPSGTVNRNGVHAAAAALAGARSGVTASDDEKKKAAKALVRYYGQLGEDPPESLTHSDLLEGVHFSVKAKAKDAKQHGVKGMRWGIRRIRGRGGLVINKIDREASDDSKLAADVKRKISKGGLHTISNEELQKLNTRLNLESQYAKLTADKTRLEKAQSKVKRGLNLGQTVNAAIQFSNSEAGRLLLEATTGKKRGKAVRFGGKKVKTRARKKS